MLRLTALIVAVVSGSAVAQPEQLWLEQFGTSQGDWYPWSAPDGNGGVVVGGYTYGDFMGPGAGGADAFMIHYSAAGQELWRVQFGSGGEDYIQAIASDGAGGLFVAGKTAGNLGEPGGGGGYDVFLARYDGTGEPIWITQFGTAGNESAAALTPDGAGGVFMAGTTAGDFGGPNAGGADVFLTRYDSAGQQAWAMQFGTDSDDSASALAGDGAGGFLVAGSTRGNLGALNAGQSDCFLARYDGEGQRVWVKQFGTSGTDEAVSLATDEQGGVFVAGTTSGSLGGVNAGGLDAFVARYDGDGIRDWIAQFGTDVGDVVFAAAPDSKGGVVVAGTTSGDLGGPSAGSGDAYLARYDSQGQQDWVAQFGTEEGDLAYSLAPGGAGMVYVAGTTYGALHGPNSGQTDVFVGLFRAECYADFTGDGVLDMFDFLKFMNGFDAEDVGSDCDQNGVLELFDFLCFVNAFNEGC